jgi:hypothetical protein
MFCLWFKRFTAPVLLFVVVFVSGCASHFEALPARQEFNKPLAELHQQYPELTNYSPSFGRHMFTPMLKMPYAEDLIAKWGEPTETSFSFWNLLDPIGHPMTRWYWNIEDKTVDALIDHPLLYGYAPHVFTLEVYEKEK